ncbi:MAG: hypothetical protein JNJ61_19420 [Anaerolineae bacterium]|nr:hypothetical protein [Anaerolineae bacterium]
MNKKFTSVAILFVVVVLLFGSIASVKNTFAQGEATVNPTIATAVALTLTAFDQSLNTPTLTNEEQIEATVVASLRKLVWIEDSTGEEHEFNHQVPPEIQAKDKQSANVWVVIEVLETEADPLNITGCGSVKRYKVDYAINSIDAETGQTVAAILLEGFVRNPFIVYDCDPLRGFPTFEDFFHWLAPQVYLIATPTPTSTYTPQPTSTPLPTETSAP